MDRLTPAMRQYMDVKSKHPDCIVLFRMGDFYETFYEDAVLAAKTLNIVLTKRGGAVKVPLAGIPYHALDNYMAKLTAAGHKVCLVEQMEDPKLAKGVVKRDIVRIVTPGTVLEHLPEKQNNYIASVHRGKTYGLAFIDISTGAFLVCETASPLETLLMHRPAEVLIPGSLMDESLSVDMKKAGLFLATAPEHLFFSGKESLKNHYGISSLHGFSLEGKDEAIQAAGALVSYLKETQRAELDHLSAPRLLDESDSLIIDPTAERNMSIVNGQKGATLLSVLDSTVTPMGGRLLKEWLLSPLRSLDRIKERHDSVEELAKQPMLVQNVLVSLRQIQDIERLVSRIALRRVFPRELVALRSSLAAIPRLKIALKETSSHLLRSDLDAHHDIHDLLARAIKDEPSAVARDGGVIREGYSEELDGLQELMKGGRKILSELEERERLATGIRGLKVGYTRVFGYYIEIASRHKGPVPERYMRKQTTANSERYITEELKALEESILNAEEKACQLEERLFVDLMAEIGSKSRELLETGARIALFDCLCSFANAALKHTYCKPEMHEGYELHLKGCRHPVLEQIESDFIPNDVHMHDSNRMMVITGPNMAGKSTYMRQVALCIAMAQAGSFVPAEAARIGVVDRLFARVGAHDDIATGQSTFMVEMTEVARILHYATDKSLILLDEIGRGTSTFDGVSLAWAVAEHISSRIRCKTLFATHYHVLTGLANDNGINNFNVAVREDRDSIIFLHKIIEGGTDKSYGIHVAKLAGIPKDVVARSLQIQALLESKDAMRSRISDKAGMQKTLTEKF
jgi:DNA mismatch repair protein MutS